MEKRGTDRWSRSHHGISPRGTPESDRKGASSVVSVVKGRPDIALGNVVGSNIANILLILGLCSTVVPLTPGGIDAVTLGAVVLSSLLLFAAAFTFRRRALDRWEGVLFLAIYGAYLWWLLAK